MDHHNGENGNLSFALSIMLGVMSIVLNNIDIVMKVILFFASILAAGMAVRYHYYATKERKQQIELNKQQEKRNNDQEKRNISQEVRNKNQEIRNIENNEKDI